MILTLSRDVQQPRPEQCTLGTISIDGRGKFATLEKPWINTVLGPAGDPDKSCIGLGMYRLEPRETEARGKHWLVSNPQLGVYRSPQDVPLGRYGRFLILIHAANWAHELLGCIAPGKMRVGPRQNGNALDEWMVAESRAAMNEVRTLIGSSIDMQLVVQIGGAQT